jgi:hypothetical protein
MMTAPAIAALTLGLFARPLLARRMGRNSAFDHAGNVAIALVAGAVGYAFSQRAVFLLVPVFAILTMIAVLSIPAKAIDYNRARDLESKPGAAENPAEVAGYGILFKSRPLVIFGLSRAGISTGEFLKPTTRFSVWLDTIVRSSLRAGYVGEI